MTLSDALWDTILILLVTKVKFKRKSNCGVAAPAHYTALAALLSHLSNFAPVVDVAADVAQFLDIWNPLCLCSASQSIGIIKICNKT